MCKLRPWPLVGFNPTVPPGVTCRTPLVGCGLPIRLVQMPESYLRPVSLPPSSPVQKLTPSAPVELPHRPSNALPSAGSAAKSPVRISPIGMAPAYSTNIFADASNMARSSSASAMSLSSRIEAIGSPPQSNGSLMKLGERAVSDQTHLKSISISTSFPPRPPPPGPVAPTVDELSKLLEKLNMRKYRRTFDDKQVRVKGTEDGSIQ